MRATWSGWTGAALVGAWIAGAGCRSEEAPRIVTAEDRALAAEHAAAAERALRGGELEAALSEAEAALEADPLSPRLHMLLARASCARALATQDPKLYADGIRLADIAVAAEPDNAEFLLERARIQFERRYYFMALRDLERRIEIAGPDPDVLRMKALCHRGLRQPKAERAAWEALVELDPTDARAHFELYRLLKHGSDEDRVRAEEELEIAARLGADDPVILQELAARKAEEGDLLSAQSLLERAVRLADEPARRLDALVNLAACAHARGQLDRARALYEDALSIDRDDDRATAGLGYVLIEQGDLEMGRAYLQVALDLTDDNDLRRDIQDVLRRTRARGDENPTEGDATRTDSREGPVAQSVRAADS